MVSADGCCTQSCRHTSVATFAVGQFLLGTTAVILGGLNIYYQDFLWYFGAGIWGGAWLVFSGIFGIIGGCRPNKSCEITHLLLTLFTLATSAAIVVIRVFGLLFGLVSSGSEKIPDFEAVSATNATRFNHTSFDICLDPLNRPGLCEFYDRGPILVDQILIAVGTFAFLFAFVSAIVTCYAVCRCCGAEWDDGNVYPVNSAMTAQPFMLPSYHQQSYMVTAPRSHKGEYPPYQY